MKKHIILSILFFGLLLPQLAVGQGYGGYSGGNYGGQGGDSKPTVIHVVIKRTTLMGDTTFEIKTKDGQVYAKQVDHPYGSPENPMGMGAIREKFWDCASQAARPFKNDSVEELLRLIPRFDTVSDIGQVVNLLDWSK